MVFLKLTVIIVLYLYNCLLWGPTYKFASYGSITFYLLVLYDLIICHCYVFLMNG